MTDRDSLEARVALLERRLKTLEHVQRNLDMHIASIEGSVVFRALQRASRPLQDIRSRLLTWGTRLGWHPPSSRRAYASFIKQEGAQEAPKLSAPVSFSLLLPVVKGRREWIEEAIGAVRGLSYPAWELCVCRRAGEEPWLEELLSNAAQSDPRVKLAAAAPNENPGQMLSRAAGLARGEYLLVVDQNGVVAPDALRWLAAEAPADLIYSDEDCLDDQGRRCAPIFKPDWSPDLLLSCMYMGRLMAFSRSAWQRAGGFMAAPDGGAGYDLALRITEGTVSVRHVPRVLFHGRRPAQSTRELREVHEQGRLLVQRALQRRGLEGQIENGPALSTYQVRWKVNGKPRASLIICSRSPGLLGNCLRAINKRTSYSNWEAVVVQHERENGADLRNVVERHSAVCVPYTGPFHFSLMNNLGAAAAGGDVLVFLNDDVEPLEPSWLERLIAQVQRPDVGAVGSRLVYPSGTLQHGGVALGVSDGCGHIGRRTITTPHWPWMQLTRDVSAVTGACLALRAELFRKSGGFSEVFPVNYGDVDLCLRLRRAGFRVVYDAGAVLRHFEGQSRGRTVTLEERTLWFDRWQEEIEAGDPFYSPHLSPNREDLSLRATSGA